MERIVLGAAIVVFSVGSVFAANPDSIVFEGGDVKIVGSGNSLVFPDGSIQSTAIVEGPQGPQGPQGPTGPQGLVGPQGPVGTYPGHVVISPNKSLKIADTLQLTATSLDSGNNKFSNFAYTWSSLTPSIATVSATGLVTAVNAGTAMITVNDTVNNVIGQIPITVMTVSGDWVSTNVVSPSAACPNVTLCEIHVQEQQNGAISITTNSCADSCGNTITIVQNGQRNGSSITLSGTLSVMPVGGAAIVHDMDCRNTWDGMNSSFAMCRVANFFGMGLTLFDHNYVRK